MTDSEIQNVMEAYGDLFSRLTIDDLTELGALVSDDIVFSDPFNLTYGREKFVNIFAHMFKVMEQPQFKILDMCYSNRAGYLKWQLTGKVKKWQQIPIDITGMSEITINGNGKIIAHYDHWDSASQLLRFIPVLGAPTRWLLKLFRMK
ncbi:MAG: nuclear transport factor 2 family protein [Alphaproteobacteria bacterium]|nr:nuclear transport factor 2 family protein [Alphaproteobacteria bacterium]